MSGMRKGNENPHMDADSAHTVRLDVQRRKQQLRFLVQQSQRFVLALAHVNG